MQSCHENNETPTTYNLHEKGQTRSGFPFEYIFYYNARQYVNLHGFVYSKTPIIRLNLYKERSNSVETKFLRVLLHLYHHSRRFFRSRNLAG